MQLQETVIDDMEECSLAEAPPLAQRLEGEPRDSLLEYVVAHRVELVVRELQLVAKVAPHVYDHSAFDLVRDCLESHGCPLLLNPLDLLH